MRAREREWVKAWVHEETTGLASCFCASLAIVTEQWAWAASSALFWALSLLFRRKARRLEAILEGEETPR